MENIPRTDELRGAVTVLDQIEFIKAGGFKAVYKAEIGGRLEAVKVIYIPSELDESEPREEIIARVKREINALSLCPTNRLVKLGSIELELITVGQHDYLVYSEEFLEGESLSEKIMSGFRPDITESITLTRCLMEALHAIDNIEHIHRDVKPDNIIATIDPDRPFVLLDLGIAYKLHGTELTRRGVGPPGTTLYMAPELFKPDYKDSLDIRSDIYSAGVTIFEYASGLHPIARRGEDERTTVYRILYQQPTRLFSLRSDLPEGFCRMIDRCIKKMPALRFANPTTLRRRLEEIS